MKFSKYLALLSTFTLLISLSALARDKKEHSVNITDLVSIGNTQLKPGSYKVEWDGSGPAVQVRFVQNRKTVATVPATLQTNNSQISQDDVVMDSSVSNKTLKEIDFAHQKEALVFTQSGM
jgi:hypothetical protein